MMDAFKVAEVKRMEAGGNAAWRAFWAAHKLGGAGGGAGGTEWRGVEAERYAGPVGAEWKERLGAKAEGRAYVEPPGGYAPKEPAKKVAAGGSGAGTPTGRNSPAPRSGSPAVKGQRERNEAYFSRLGAANADRPDDLPPSQGGKLGGFGGGVDPTPPRTTGGGAPPALDEFQRDPVAAMSKGWGWFAGAVGKSAKTLEEGYLRPGMQKVFSRTCYSVAIPLLCTFFFLADAASA